LTSRAVQLSPHCRTTGKQKLHSRLGVFYFRQKIPNDLLPYFGGLQEIKKSLKTRSPTLANTSFSLLSSKTEKLFVDLRCLLEVAPMSELTKKQIEEMVRDYFRTTLEDAEEHRSIFSGSNLPPSDTCAITSQLEQLTADLTTGNTSNISQLIEGLLKGLTVDPNSYQTLARELIKAQIEVLKVELKREQGDYSSEMGYLNGGSKGAATIEPPPLPPKKKTKLLSEAMDLRVKELEARDKAPKTISDAKSIYALLLRVLGDRDVTEYTYEDFMEARETLLKLPKSTSSSAVLKRLPIAKILEAENLDRLPKYAEKTVHNQLTYINTLFNFCEEKGWIDKSRCPKWEKSKTLKRATGYCPYDQDDLKRLFQSSFCNSRVQKPQNYWVPLISLYSGLRLDEVCQLYKEDILTVDGVLCFSVNPDKEDKKVKSDTSIRLVPVHTKLVELGLLAYVEKLQTERLFPQLKRGGNGYSHEFGKKFCRFNMTLPLKTEPLQS
jgi:integrase